MGVPVLTRNVDRPSQACAHTEGGKEKKRKMGGGCKIQQDRLDELDEKRKKKNRKRRKKERLTFNFT